MKKLSGSYASFGGSAGEGPGGGVKVSGGDVKSSIMNALRSMKLGLTIEQLSGYVGANRQTISKYVLVLEAQGALRRRKVGMAILHYPGQVVEDDD